MNLLVIILCGFSIISIMMLAMGIGILCGRGRFGTSCGAFSTEQENPCCSSHSNCHEGRKI